MSKELTAIYFAWFRQVVEDEALPAAAFKLAFVYQQHMSSDHMKAFAGQARLAKAVGVSARSIRTLTKLLKDRGHLDVVTNHGPNQTNVCRLILNRKTASSFGYEVHSVWLSAIDGNEEAGFLINEEVERTKRGNLASENRKPASDKSLLNHSYNQERPRGGRQRRPRTSAHYEPLPPCSVPCLIPRTRRPEIADALGSLGPSLEARLGPDAARSWFGKAVITDVVGDTLTLEVPTQYGAARVKSDYEPALLACCSALVPAVKVIRVVVAEKAGAAA
ncbi:hypothetical protein [Bradyrhizobium sp. JYMT SZCCT0428]|uniref:hypothetical protein n=1 Tax=Bradyrhizobium sp. JYMT SZCCT0428 TaxID=2807673 RepID=UPI001BA4435A|nr:hypothetical protein [Bradyrhizobium sp. JYMT SZCCT0428]MBR1154180.1 hypothetical protein [Bradyrhizobium sp. JYMT SZCCT0428]